MRRLLVATLVAVLAVAGCAEAFEPPDSSAPGGAEETTAPQPGSTAGTEGGPTTTPEPTPAVTAVADLPEEGEDFVPVKVLGWIETGGSVLCGSDTCDIRLVDPFDPNDDVRLEVATDAGGAPGTMRPLGSSYVESELEVTGDDGTSLYSGAYAWVTGAWDPAAKTLYPDRIEAGSPPAQTAVATTLARLRSRKAGTLVKVAGRLDTPFLLSCWGGSCNLYLQDPKKPSRSVRIEVRLGPKSGSRPNTMRPLGDNFRNGQLRVVDHASKVCRYGDRVSITGWVFKSDDGSPFVDPVRSITCLGK
jgi:hypothetical protein